MEIKIAVRQCADDSGSPRRFHYFLIVEQEETPRFCCETYGVRIMEEEGGSAALPALTTSPTQIDELMTLLVDNHVGPVGLSDVVEDWRSINAFSANADPAFAEASPAGQ